MPVTPGVNGQIMLKVLGKLSEKYDDWMNQHPTLNRFLNGPEYINDSPAYFNLSGGPFFKKMKSFEELESIRNGLAKSVSGTVHASKNGRTAIDVKKVVAGPKRYVRTTTVTPKKTYEKPAAVVTGPKTAKEILEQDPTAYMNALGASGTAAEMNLPGLSKMFYEDAQFLNPQRDAFKSRFLWGELYEQGGILSAKSGIHIKKENRGKFTDYCGGKVTSECISRGKASSNPTIRKRATFAANARKWAKKHKNGGNVPFWVHDILGGE